MNGLKYALFAKGVSSTELSEELGVSPQLVNLWSNQRRSIPNQYLETLSDFFEIEPELFEKELLLQDKIQIEMQLNAPKLMGKEGICIDTGSTNIDMYHRLEMLSRDYKSLLFQYNQEAERSKQHEELINLIHELSGKNKTKYAQKEQPFMNKVFIGNSNDSVCTDVDKIIQYQINVNIISCRDGKCTIRTSISGRLTEQWTEVLMNETLTVPLDLAVKSDGVYLPDVDGEESASQIIQSEFRFRYWIQIEEMAHHIKNLKNSPAAEPSDLFLIPREHLSIVHTIREAFGDECLIDAQWD